MLHISTPFRVKRPRSMGMGHCGKWMRDVFSTFLHVTHLSQLSALMHVNIRQLKASIIMISIGIKKNKTKRVHVTAACEDQRQSSDNSLLWKWFHVGRAQVGTEQSKMICVWNKSLSLEVAVMIGDDRPQAERVLVIPANSGFASTLLFVYAEVVDAFSVIST